MSPATIAKIFRSLSDSLPDPKTELVFQDHYQLLIAVMLSAQATDVSVNRVTASLFKAAPTPEKMVKLGEKGIRKHIMSVGLFNTKAKNILNTSRILLDVHNGEVPRTREALEALPGVGQKTAGVVLNVAYGEATIPVDTHVYRVSNRLGLVRTKTPAETEKQLLAIVPWMFLPKAHHLLILHGRYVCKARRPLCVSCCVQLLCEYKEKTATADS